MALIIESDGTPEAESLLKDARRLAEQQAAEQRRNRSPAPKPQPIPEKMYHRLIHEFHGQSDFTGIDPLRLAKVAALIARGAHPLAAGEAAWAYMQAALQAGNTGYLGPSSELLKRGMQEAAGTAREIELGLAKIAIPAYRELASGGVPDASAMAKRAHHLNHRLLEVKDGRKDNSLVGVAPEVAVVYLMNRFFASYPDSYTGAVSWPATPWQDAHFDGKHSRSNRPPYNFDVMDGYHPGAGDKIQLKASVEQGSVQKILGKNLDTEVYLEYWQDHHDPDITLIFGDVHLWNTRRNPFLINEAIDDVAYPRRNLILDTATVNIISEIDATRARVAALAETQPAE